MISLSDNYSTAEPLDICLDNDAKQYMERWIKHAKIIDGSHANIFKYKGFEIIVKTMRDGRYFGGYIDKIPLDKFKLFSIDEMANFTAISGIYEPHNGFFANCGIMCDTLNDMHISPHGLAWFDNLGCFVEEGDLTSSFKTGHFVLIELMQVVDSIIKVMNKRSI